MLIIWIVLLIFFVIVVIISIKQKEKIVQALQSVADKRYGRVINRLILYPTLYLDHNGTEIRIQPLPGSRYSPPQTVLTAKHRMGLNHKLIISRESILSRMAKALGMKEIQIGSDEFDNKFIVKGDDDYFVYRVLDYNLQEKIINAWRFEPYINISSNSLQIIFPYTLEREEEYNMMIDLAISILDKLKEMNPYIS